MASPGARWRARYHVRRDQMGSPAASRPPCASGSGFVSIPNPDECRGTAAARSGPAAARKHALAMAKRARRAAIRVASSPQERAIHGGEEMLEGLVQHDHPLTLQHVLGRMRNVYGDSE